jgi:hypothetical protein
MECGAENPNTPLKPALPGLECPAP